MLVKPVVFTRILNSIHLGYKNTVACMCNVVNNISGDKINHGY